MSSQCEVIAQWATSKPFGFFERCFTPLSLTVHPCRHYPGSFHLSEADLVERRREGRIPYCMPNTCRTQRDSGVPYNGCDIHRGTGAKTWRGVVGDIVKRVRCSSRLDIGLKRSKSRTYPESTGRRCVVTTKLPRQKLQRMTIYGHRSAGC